jgi:hypothetical protein
MPWATRSDKIFNFVMGLVKANSSALAANFPEGYKSLGDAINFLLKLETTTEQAGAGRTATFSEILRSPSLECSLECFELRNVVL